MSADENNPTTPKQMTLIILIVIVFFLLLIQLIASAGSGGQLPSDRDSCLNSGNIWSQTAQECYGSDTTN